MIEESGSVKSYKKPLFRSIDSGIIVMYYSMGHPFCKNPKHLLIVSR